MENILKTIDTAIKRLVSPVTMLVAAALLSKGLDKPEASPATIKSLMVLLGIWAVGYMVLSATQAIKEFEAANINGYKKWFLSTSFILVYFVLCISAIKLGFDKLVA
ncbi:hypothetical protein IMCC1989_2102 [gamma proteobacterium IMCC1989]|nr:hypothetical protein IMCC1989_2102 [gamma proteobacterium IMCC1989]